MAKDRKPDDGPAGGRGGRGTATGTRGGASRASGGGAAAGNRGRRSRPPTQVVAHQRPWAMIAAALALLVFAAAVIGYAVVQVRRSEANRISSPEQIAGVQTFTYASGQEHVTTPVDYKESPPVGGPHDPYWADCTGTVYKVDIRHENAVHSLEHGAVWITYNPDKVSAADIDRLAALVKGKNGRLMSAYAGLDAPISIQSWNHQLKVQNADDKRLQQFADFFALNPKYYPEVGASCENPSFAAKPVLEGQPSPGAGAGGAGGMSGAPSSGAAPSGAAPSASKAP